MHFVTWATTCLRALNYYMPTFPHFSRVYVLTCLHIFFVPMCLCALNYFVPTSALFYVFAYLKPLTKYSITVFLRIIWPFIPFNTPKQTPASKTAYFNPTLWGFVISAGECVLTIIWRPIKGYLRCKTITSQNVNLVPSACFHNMRKGKRRFFQNFKIFKNCSGDEVAQNVSSEAQVKNFVKKLCSAFKIFKFLYF